MIEFFTFDYKKVLLLFSYYQTQKVSKCFKDF